MNSQDVRNPTPPPPPAKDPFLEALSDVKKCVAEGSLYEEDKSQILSKKVFNRKFSEDCIYEPEVKEIHNGANNLDVTLIPIDLPNLTNS